MIRVRIITAVVLLLFGHTVLAADSSGSSEPIGKAKPFSFTFGPQKDGGLGASLKGDEFLSPDKWRASVGSASFVAPYVGVVAEGKWSSETSSTNSADIALQIGAFFGSLDIAIFSPASPAFDLQIDGRYQAGTVHDAATNTTGQLNRNLLGATFKAQVPYAYKLVNTIADYTDWMDPIPYLSLTYHHVSDNSDPQVAANPAIVSDQLAAGLYADLHIPSANFNLNGKKWQLLFEAQLVWSRATEGADQEWKRMTNLALKLDSGQELKPVLRYMSGTQEGLEYDRQLILGLLWELANKK